MKENKPTVLIVDDEQLYCDLLGAILSRSGYEVVTALTGLDGIKLFKQRRPRFTLLDLRLPDIHGIEVLKEIRKVDQQAAVMVLTNWGTDYMEQQARQLGVRDFFSKKITLDTIMASLAGPPVDEVPVAAGGVAGAPGAGDGGASQPAEAAIAAAPASTTGTAEKEKSEQILVVDDEPEILDVVSQFLTQRGYGVRVASGGAEALSLMEKESPSLLILDIYMPGVNGIGVLRELFERKSAVPVILLTGSQDEKLLAESMDLGAVEIIGKPVDLEQLALAVHLGLQIKKQ
ncbi:MAG: response regulator [Nitrospirales bacterium]|nr:response regulator [Nitrospirales bacterium]